MTEDSVNLHTGWKVLLGMVIVIGGLALVLSRIDKRRNQDMTSRYTTEAQAYMAENHEGLKKLFSEIFAQAARCHADAERTYQGGYQSDLRADAIAACEPINRQAIEQALTSDLKDFSSTYFVRLGGGYVLHKLFLSGKFGVEDVGPSMGKEKEEVLKLLRGEKTQIPWDDYFYDFSGKEVIIPFTIDGSVNGAIVRRVVEE